MPVLTLPANDDEELESCLESLKAPAKVLNKSPKPPSPELSSASVSS